jgi:hypothetical protein
MNLTFLGDSVSTPTGGAGLPGPGYSTILGNFYSATVANVAQGATHMFNIARAAYGLTPSQSVKYCLLAGYNDMRYYGTNLAGQNSYKDGLRATVAWLAGACQVKAKDAVKTGSWTNSANGIGVESINPSGAAPTLTATAYGTTVYVAYRRAYTSGDNYASFALFVDGVRIFDPTFGLGQSPPNYGGQSQLCWQVLNISTTAFPASDSASIVRISGLAAGAHTISITNNYTGKCMVDWIGGNQVTVKPHVYLGNTLKPNPASNPISNPYNQSSDTAAQQFNVINAQCVNDLVADGFNVHLVDVYTGFDINTMLYTDLVHPNNTVGCPFIASKFEAVIPTDPPLTYTQKGLYLGSDGVWYVGDDAVKTPIAVP